MITYAEQQRAESLYRLEEAEHLAAYGIAPQEIAERLGTTRTALEQLARRHGRADLARRLSAYRAAACPGCGEPMAPTATRCRECVRLEGRERHWSKQVPA
jgi:hypothetical protein